MSEALAPAVDMRVLAALSAGEMPAVQKQLTDWLSRKLAAITTDISMFEENIRVAERANMKTGAFKSVLARSRRLFNYYEKLKVAVHNGYVIIPDLQATTIAVRVDKEKPSQQHTHSDWKARTAVPQPSLPAGVGRYVDDENHIDTWKVDSTNYKNEPCKIDMHVATDFDEEIDFPMLVVKPVVLEATQQAMALNVFDRIGVVGARRKDPLVVGEILGPNGKKQVFFIAWWLDVETL